MEARSTRSSEWPEHAKDEAAPTGLASSNSALGSPFVRRRSWITTAPMMFLERPGRDLRRRLFAASTAGFSSGDAGHMGRHVFVRTISRWHGTRPGRWRSGISRRPIRGGLICQAGASVCNDFGNRTPDTEYLRAFSQIKAPIRFRRRRQT